MQESKVLSPKLAAIANYAQLAKDGIVVNWARIYKTVIKMLVLCYGPRLSSESCMITNHGKHVHSPAPNSSRALNSITQEAGRSLLV